MSQVICASSLLGCAVFNSGGEKVGVIKELMLESDHGLIAYAVMCTSDDDEDCCDKNFTIPYSSLEVDADADRVLLEVDRESLSNTPGLKREDIPSLLSSSARS